MVSRTKLSQELDTLLKVDLFKDYCPNGLQVEGCEEIQSLITGVTASKALIDKACEKNVDALLVHHGFFWKGENPTITGYRKDRIRELLKNDINLFAYHLPLDCHVTYGNNIQLAAHLDFKSSSAFSLNGVPNLLWQGQLNTPLSADEFKHYLNHRLSQPIIHLPGANEIIAKVAWCTGGAQKYIVDAASLGVDAFISGETSEQTTHLARELGIHYFGCGHHATERYGVEALGGYLANKFSLNHYFIDIPNPV